MNNDFPRILTLLRKERNLSQKQAAADLGIAQALLSHYEKGKRECGLDFLAKAADYYNVSTDYLLGRSPVSSGSVISQSNIPEAESADKARNLSPEELSSTFAKKLVTNSVDVIYSLLSKTKNVDLISNISDIFSLTVYKSFRIIYQTNKENDTKLFKVPDEIAFSMISAGEAASTASAIKSVSNSEQAQPISRASLEHDYQKQASILLNTVMNCEKKLSKYE